MAEEIRDDEEQHSDTVANDPPKRKRAPAKRKPKAAALITGPGVTVIHNKFVDSYTGELVDNTVGIPGYEDVARFATLPTMVAYLEENCKSKEDYSTLCAAVAEKFEQQLPLPRAPPNVLLRSFGGKLDFVEYISDLAVWDALTAEKGENVEEYQKRTSSKKRGNASKKRTAAASASISTGLVKIVHTSATAAAIKVCNANEANLDKESKQKSTPSSFIKSQNSFIAKTSDVGEDLTTKRPRFQRVLHETPQGGFTALLLQPTAVLAEEESKSLSNHVAQRLTGVPAYGPAVVFAHRKLTVKL
jgi:hypothetical protein